MSPPGLPCPLTPACPSDRTARHGPTPTIVDGENVGAGRGLHTVCSDPFAAGLRSPRSAEWCGRSQGPWGQAGTGASIRGLRERFLQLPGDPAAPESRGGRVAASGGRSAGQRSHLCADPARLKSMPCASSLEKGCLTPHSGCPCVTKLL